MTREGLIEVMARAIAISRVGPDVVIVGKESKMFATAALSAIEAAGVRLVPSEPTGDMAIAGGEAAQRSIGSWGEPELCYRAMLAASPYAPQKDESHE